MGGRTIHANNAHLISNNSAETHCRRPYCYPSTEGRGQGIRIPQFVGPANPHYVLACAFCTPSPKYSNAFSAALAPVRMQSEMPMPE